MEETAKKNFLVVIRDIDENESGYIQRVRDKIQKLWIQVE